MIHNCDNSYLHHILSYIGDDYQKCLYLYLDILKYGCSSEMTRTWIQFKNDRISAVLLAYHTALHIYSKDNDFDLLETTNIIKSVNPTIINAASTTILLLESELIKIGYSSEYGHIGEWISTAFEMKDSIVIAANEKDIPEIARLLYEDTDIGASYSYEDLLKQMLERLNQGYVRSYVIRKNGKPIAHVGTGAEINGVCTIAYTIVAPEYRGLGLAKQLYNQACCQLKSEGNRIFSIYYPENAHQFHHKVGFVDVCKCGKLFKYVK